MIRRFDEYFPHSKTDATEVSSAKPLTVARNGNLRVGLHGVAGIDSSFVKSSRSSPTFPRLYLPLSNSARHQIPPVKSARAPQLASVFGEKTLSLVLRAHDGR